LDFVEGAVMRYQNASAAASIAEPGAIEGSHRFGALFGPFVGGLYGAFALLFAYLQVWPLAAAYLACLLFDALAFLYGQRYPARRNPLLSWVWVVVFAQALLAVRVLGAGAGFQYYLLVTIPPGFAAIGRPLWVKLLQGGAIVVFFLACDIWLRDWPPLYAHTAEFLATLRHVNIVGSCAMLAGAAFVQGLVIKESGDALRRIASTDPLTGLYNRRAFSEIAEREVARSRRTAQALTLALGDIDFFKRVNDQYGHAAGDHVLQTVANRLPGALRDYDCVARWGGEEFVILLPATDAASALVIVERLRETIAASHPAFEGTPIPVTMTFGVAQFAAEENWHAIVARADEALYRGKSAGRNRVELG
jgi:diguanylate cyclase (GGDEF)-like protein